MTGMDVGPVPTSYPTLFRRTFEGSAEVMEVVEDGDLPRAICHEQKTVGLVESHHFYIGVCFEIHRAGETNDVSVLVARLVHRGERVEEGFPGGVEDHGADFYSSTHATGRMALPTTRWCGRNDNK